MANANINISIENDSRGITISNIDLDAKRDQLALDVGRMVVDALWEMTEGR